MLKLKSILAIVIVLFLIGCDIKEQSTSINSLSSNSTNHSSFSSNPNSSATNGSTPSNNISNPTSSSIISSNSSSIDTSKVYTVSTSTEFDSVVSKVLPGETILITTSIYSDLNVRKKSGTEDKPITILVKSDLVFIKSLEIRESSYLVIDGLNFEKGVMEFYLKIMSSKFLEIKNCVFDHKENVYDKQTSILITPYGGNADFIEIHHNLFKDMIASTVRGSFIKTTYDDNTGIAKNVHIHNNTFKNLPVQMVNGNPVGDSDRETIVFGAGQSHTIETNNIVEYNMFEDCDGEDEIITIKTSRNIIRYNTFYNCFGGVTVRSSSNTEVYGNFFLGNGASSTFTDPNYQTGGVRVYGSNHKVYNNYFQGLTGTGHRSSLLIDGGDTENVVGGGHPRCKKVDVFNNTIINCITGIVIGKNYTLHPLNIKVYNNVVIASSTVSTFTGMTASLNASENDFKNNYSFGGLGPDSGFKGVTIANLNFTIKSIAIKTGKIFSIFIPSSTSITINNGIEIDYIMIDIFSNKRIGTIDVGAIEYIE